MGMTKKQFLKKSKKALNDTGGILLLIRGIIFKEEDNKISHIEASNQLNNIRKGIESIFFEFDELNPPSKCIKLHLRILRSLITLQESVNLYSQYLNANNNDQKEKSKKLEESMKLLDEFRKEYHILADDVKTLLK